MLNETTPIALEKLTPSEIFVGDQLDVLLKQIRSIAIKGTPDLSTVGTRKEIASRAAAVSKSKVLIDNAGKELTAEWREKTNLVNAARNKAKTALESLRDEVRKPLTDWENEQARIEEERIEKARQECLAREAAEKAELERRENEIRQREEAIAKKEREAAEREAATLAEQQRIQREDTQKAAIAEAAELERIASIEREKRAKEQAVIDAKLAADRAEQEKIEAVRLAEDNLIKKQLAEAAELERQELVLKEAERAASENKEHRRKINAEAVAAFVKEGLSEDAAKSVVRLIASSSIPNITIKY